MTLDLESAREGLEHFPLSLSVDVLSSWRVCRR
jgi:hypothetical protein